MTRWILYEDTLEPIRTVDRGLECNKLHTSRPHSIFRFSIIPSVVLDVFYQALDQGGEMPARVNRDRFPKEVLVWDVMMKKF